MIRKAEAKDFAEMARKGREFWEQTDYRDIPYSEESILTLLPIMAEQGLLFLAETDGEIVGFIGGLICPVYANNAYMSGSELFWYLDPRYRKGREAIGLLQAIEKAAKEAGCNRWSMMALEAVEPERAEQIYIRAGYKLTERSYTKVL